MIAYDLVCAAGDHRFEGWFASSAEFDRQKEQGLVSCPYCGSGEIAKAMMAPNIGRKGNQALSRPSNEQTAPSPSENSEPSLQVSNQPEVPPEIRNAIAEIAKMQNKMLEKSEWVGRQFAEEARAIHYGESGARTIHGEATHDEALALHEEGVSVAPLPLPFIPPQAKN
jgi:hypothetical protein